MFLRQIERRKNGKTHLYLDLVENKRLDGGGVVQRARSVFGRDQFVPGGGVAQGDRGVRRGRGQLSDDRCEVAVDDRLGGAAANFGNARLHRPRQWGRPVGWRACCGESCNSTVLGGAPAREPEANALGSGVLQVLVAYRLIEPGSEWRLRREWFGKSAMARSAGGGFPAWPRRTSSMPATACCSPTRTRAVLAS